MALRTAALLIDDDARLGTLMTEYLGKHEIDVVVAGDGTRGLAALRKTRPDIVLLDIMLPGMDGWEVLLQLRREKKTPVLILSARDSVPDRVRGLDTGADDYLVKPFDLVELLSRLRALIRRAAGDAQSVIRMGDVTVDVRSRTVESAGSRVVLTAREYALIEFLAMHRGELVTRTMIYEHLFDENDDTLSNLVDVYVASIRRKLGKDLITTRRGQGYIIDV
jgi:two-component system OmpR family response regulator